MTVNRRKKCRKLRASRTHGWGSPKKHRGAGSRGGVGNAGAGKKGQQNMTTKHNQGLRIGNYGFKKPPATLNNPRTINLDDIEKHIEKYVAKSIAKQEKGITQIDAGKLGCDKVLARGRLTKKLKITAKEFSKSAIEKIKKAGGEAIVVQPAEKKDAEDKKEISSPSK